MNADLKHADSRALHESLRRRLVELGPHETFSWLTSVLETQSPGLRSSNSYLVAYTGCLEAIDWLEGNVASPVTTHWGSGAALLGTPWPRLVNWLRADGPQRLMALDTLIAYRAPAPNMSALAQIASPVLPEPPTSSELQIVLGDILRSQSTPRLRQAVEYILSLANEILDRRERGVEVKDLPRLYMEPEAFPGAQSILTHHERVHSDIRKGLQDLMNQHPIANLGDKDG
jgi:hypothetical protein